MGSDFNKPLLDLAREAIGWQQELWTGIQRRVSLQPSLLAACDASKAPEALLAGRGSADDVLDRLRAAAAV